MKVIIKNWGPIAEGEYDLDKSLIVTYGDNNIGKSYAMNKIYSQMVEPSIVLDRLDEELEYDNEQ